MIDIQLKSPAFDDQDLIPERYTHLGGNISPPLAWSQAPREAAELLLLCEDPDAPSGTFLHWLVTGIDPATRSVAEGRALDIGQQWSNGFGEKGWGGPQPPAGDLPHHYHFQVHALARPLRLPPHPGIEQVHEAIEAAQPMVSGTLTGLYGR
jgi:Raf kinase inhibitor-like YbhB/YbcL family protein